MSPQTFAIILMIVSTLLGYSMPYIVKFFKFLIGRRNRKEILTGSWHGYHFSRMHGNLVLRNENWRIARNPLNQLTVKLDYPENPKLKYKGTISVERNYLLVLLRGVYHKEEVQLRFFDVIPTGQDMALGLCMGVDFDIQPLCMLYLLSRKKLGDQEAERILKAKTLMKDYILTIASPQ